MSNEIWHADIPITKEQALACIQAQFPSLNPILSIEYMDAGWDNQLFLINDQIIFRFPRRKIAVETLARENIILNALQPLIAIKAPNPEFIGQASDLFPYPFQGYHRIDGQSACRANLSPQQRQASLPALADFLKTLHGIDETRAEAMGVSKILIFDRSHTADLIGKLKERINKIELKDLARVNKSCFEQEMAIVADLKLSADRCLIHGDLYCKHLIFDQGNLNGIIDWGDSGINHRAIDLGIVYSFYPVELHEQFYAIYGEVDAVTANYARFIGLYIALTVLPYAEEVKDAFLKQEAILSVNRINPDLLTIP